MVRICTSQNLTGCQKQQTDVLLSICPGIAIPAGISPMPYWMILPNMGSLGVKTECSDYYIDDVCYDSKCVQFDNTAAQIHTKICVNILLCLAIPHRIISITPKLSFFFSHRSYSACYLDCTGLKSVYARV